MKLKKIWKVIFTLMIVSFSLYLYFGLYFGNINTSNENMLLLFWATILVANPLLLNLIWK